LEDDRGEEAGKADGGRNWREDTLTRMRALIPADPDMIEGEVAQAIESSGGPGLVAPRDRVHRRDQKAVKLTFAHGADVPIHLASTRAWKATCDGRSTSPKAKRQRRRVQGASWPRQGQPAARSESERKNAAAPGHTNATA
jgi:hypothetical protein